MITADVMIADVSSGNTNEMYELGIRHALRRGATVLLTRTSSRLPFNLMSSFALHYELDAYGRVLALDDCRALLTKLLTEKVERPSTDSPLFEYFPNLQVLLPDDLQPTEARQRSYSVGTRTFAPRGPDRRAAVARAEQIVRGSADVDPQVRLDLLRRYRDLGAWDDVIRSADELPPDVAHLPQAVHAVALAHSRLGNTNSAIAVLKQHVERSGGDPESDGMLGSLYKKKYFADGLPWNLEQAIEHYRRALEANPQDLYLGRNLAQLLHRQGTDSARKDLLKLLPHLISLAQTQIAEPVHDFWTLESALILEVLAGDIASAFSLADKMLALHPEPWMLETSRTELQGVLECAVDAAERERIQAMIDRLIPTALDEAEEVDDAQL